LSIFPLDYFSLHLANRPFNIPSVMLKSWKEWGFRWKGPQRSARLGEHRVSAHNVTPNTQRQGRRLRQTGRAAMLRKLGPYFTGRNGLLQQITTFITMLPPVGRTGDTNESSGAQHASSRNITSPNKIRSIHRCSQSLDHHNASALLSCDNTSWSKMKGVLHRPRALGR
jgi:hypothetical protein